MTFNILRNSIIRNDTSCRHDNNDGWAVVWDENDNFKGYEVTSGLTSMLVWDRAYVAATTSGSCYVGPSTDQAPIDAMVYSTVKVYMRIEENPRTSIVPTTARIQFKSDDDLDYQADKVIDFPISVDNAYNEYTIDMSQLRKWTGSVTRIRLYPFIDGAPGYVVHLKSIRVESSHQFSCDTSFNGSICNKYAHYVHPCPFVGRGGSSESSLVNDGIEIAEGVNDKLIVDINGYGRQAVTLTPVRGARLEDIGRDLEEKLSNIGIGGYAGCRVDVTLSRLKITADDTREASSTVFVYDTPAARTLGFYDAQGVAVSTELTGEDAASRYEPAGTIQLSKAQIAQLYKANPSTDDQGVELDVGEYALVGGRSDFAMVHRDIKIDFTGKTIIDFNNPINMSGVLSSVAYSGDAYSTTEFRVFRPYADGTLECVFSTSMDVATSSIDAVFEKSVSFRVRKGDYLGIYDGRIDAAKTEEFPNASYVIYDGDLQIGQSIQGPPDVSGRGERGLRLFGHGVDKQTAVVLNVEFEQQELVEEVRVVAEEDARVEEINLTHARAGGLNGGVYVTATTGVDKFGSPAPGWTDLAALFDTKLFHGPGVDNAHPSWMDTNYEPSDKFDQTELTIKLDFAKGVPVLFDINRVVLYFKDVNNVKYFGLEYPLTTDDLDNEQYFGYVAAKYDEVYMDGKLLVPDDHPLYYNPLSPNVSNFIDGYQVLEYKHLDLRFDPVKSRALKYCVKNYAYESDVSKSTYSMFTLAPSPRIVEMEVYAQSVPTASIADNFSFESSVDDSKFYIHHNVESEGETSARYLIGYPVQYLRIRVTPQGRMVLKNFQVSTSTARTRVNVSASPDGSVSLNIPRDNFTDSQSVSITNETDSTYNFFVNIAAQRSPADRCILWNKLDNDDSVSLSEVGPSAVVYKREDYYPREYNYALDAPAYILDKYWMMNRNCRTYVSYDQGATWLDRGNILCDYNEDTYLTSENPQGASVQNQFVYILVDLGDVYALDTVQVTTPNSYGSFDGPLYSSRDVGDPSELHVVDDFVGLKNQARWMRFRAFSDEVGASNGVAAISYIQTSLDPTNVRNKGKLPWVRTSLLTNYAMGDTALGGCGEGWHCSESGYNNWYCFDLEDNYRVTNLIVGPVDNQYVEVDIDTIEPGDGGTLFDVGDYSHADVAFSQSNVSDPSRVQWGSLGNQAGERQRWILIRRRGGLLDELVVHIEDNVQANKPAFAEPRWWTALYGTPVKDRGEYSEGTHSISVTYPKNNQGRLEEMELTQSLGIDHVLAKRDQLRVLLYFSDITQVDITKGHITIGKNTTEENVGREPLSGVEKDRTNYFQWPLSQLPTLHSGWNEVYLPFTDNFRVGRPKFEEDNLLLISHGDVSGRSRFRWFRVSFAGKQNNTQFDVKVGGIQIVRGTYLPGGKFGNALYLAGDEYAKFPLYNFNVFEGTIEFFLNPDWNKDPGCHTCEDGRDHTIFRIFNNDGFVLGAFMTGHGLRVYLKDTEERHFFLTDNSSVRLIAGQTHHVAVSWDLLGKKSSDALRVYIDNVLSATFELEAAREGSYAPNPDATLILGGHAWEGVTEKRVSSIDGTIENIKVFNFAKSEFSFSLENQELEGIRTSDDLIELSLDNVNFYGANDRGNGMPLLRRNVAPGETFSVYIRRKDVDSGFPDKGQERTAYIEVLRAIPG